MTTTVLFVEHLITGLQAAVWILLVIFSCFGYDWIKLNVLKDLNLLAVVILTSLTYPIGIFVDNFADAILKNRSQKIRDETIKREKLEDRSLFVMKVLRDVDDDYLKAYIGYIRTRIRISRSTAVNFALITVASLIFTSTRLNHLPQPQLVLLLGFEGVAGLAITFLALLSWRSITNTFAKQIVRAAKAFDKAKGQNRNNVLDATPDRPLQRKRSARFARRLSSVPLGCRRRQKFSWAIRGPA